MVDFSVDDILFVLTLKAWQREEVCKVIQRTMHSDLLTLNRATQGLTRIEVIRIKLKKCPVYEFMIDAQFCFKIFP